MPTNLQSIQGLLGDVGNVAGQLGGIYDQARSIGNLFDGSPNFYDELGNIDITKPGITTETKGTQFGDQTLPYVQPGLDYAQQVFQAGPVELNPLQTAAYNQVASGAQQGSTLAGQGAGLLGNILSGSDPYTRQLATEAAAATASPFASAGTLGSTRSQLAANKAASDAILSRQLDAQGRIGTAQQDIQRPIDLLSDYGQQHQDYLTQAPREHLQAYQDATGFGGSTGTQTGTAVTSPSGADIYNARLGQFLTGSQLQNLVNDGSLPAGGGSTGNPLTDVATGIGTIGNIIDTGTSIWDTVSGWFAEGGEVKGRY